MDPQGLSELMLPDERKEGKHTLLAELGCLLVSQHPAVSGMEIVIDDSWRALSLEGLHSGFYI